MISAARAGLRVSIWSLFMGTPRLSLLEASDLALVWPPPFGFQGFLKSPAPQGPTDSEITWPPKFEPLLERLVLKNSKIYLETPTQNTIPLTYQAFILSTVGLDIDLKMSSWEDIDLELEASSVNAALAASSLIEETSIEIDASIRGTHVGIQKIKTTGERLNLDARILGQLKLPTRTGRSAAGRLDSIKFNATGKANADLSLLGSILDLSDTRGPIKGDFNFDGTIPFNSNAKFEYKVKGSGKAQDAQLSGFRLFDSSAKFEIDSDAVKLPEVNILVGERALGTAKGEIKLNKSMDFDFRAAPEGLPLHTLLQALDVDFDLIDTGIQSPNLRIQGHGEPLLIKVGATAQFNDLTLPTMAYSHEKHPHPPDCRFDFHLLVTSSQLDFNGTKGFCFNTPEDQHPRITAGNYNAPTGATHVSPLTFGGQIVFGSRLQLYAHSDALDLNLANYYAQVPLSGQATLHTAIHGPFSQVKIDNSIEAKDVTVAGVPLGQVRGQAAVVGEHLEWKEVVIRPAEGGALQLRDGRMNFDDDLTFRTKVLVEAVDAKTVEQAVHASDPNLNFAMAIQSLSGELTGPLLRPFAMTGQIRSTIRDISLDKERLADSVYFSLEAKDSGWTTDDLTISLSSLVLKVKAQMARKPTTKAPPESASDSSNEDVWSSLGLNLDDPVAIEFSTVQHKPGLAAREATTSVDDHLTHLPFVGAKLKDIGLSGLFLAKGKFSGNLSHLQGNVQGSVDQPKVFGSTLSPINFRGFLNSGKLDIMLDHSGSAFEGRLSMDLAEKGVPYEWFYHFNKMDLRPLGTNLFHADPRNYIYLTADWRMKGKFDDWWRSTGELEIKDLRGKYVSDVAAQTRSMQLRQEAPVTLIFSKAGWKFKDDKDLYLSGQNLQLRVSMNDSRPPEHLGIKIDGIVDVALAKEFSQSIDTAQGKVRVTCDITGPATSPDITVDATDLKNTPFIAATWSPVSIGFADLRPPLKNMKFHVIYKNGKIIIDQFTASKGSGTISANGSLNVSDSSPEETHLDLILDDATFIFPVAFLKSFETQISGNISVTGKGLPFKVAGDLVINKARSTKEVDIRNEIINALRQKSFTTTIVQETPSVLLDLNVRADQSVNIHNRNIQGILSSNLSIRGTDIEPSVSGQVEINKGRFIYKRDFTITRGLLLFDDPVKPDPSLDIVAQSEVDAYRVYISITGRGSNPTVEFSIDPPTRENGESIKK
ncbi:hypothetical protein E3A20_12000, partial [Planctomyces bekefii]